MTLADASAAIVPAAMPTSGRHALDDHHTKEVGLSVHQIQAR
jgi:hypothetical protein